MRLKTLNGAPLPEQLNFSESQLLEHPYDLQNQECLALSGEATPSVKWRCLTKEHTRLRTGWSQPYLPGADSKAELTLSSMSIPNAESPMIFQDDGTTGLDRTIALGSPSFDSTGFLQQSLIFHDNLLSSQVLPNKRPDDTASSASFLTSFDADESSIRSPSRAYQDDPMLHMPPHLVITPLVSVPSAPFLQSIYPQTPTPSFLCVLMTSPERREVLVRKGQYKMDLWELNVADHTRSDFKVTFWLRPPRQSNSEQMRTQSSTLQTLTSSKIGDILLLRNIALTSFREVVYGQSLNPAITRARTTVEILKDNGYSDKHSSGMPPALFDTFLKVQRWARVHVASDVLARKRKNSNTKDRGHSKRTSSNRYHDDDSLPPDTMEAA